jgi:predicted  nucleic acid-binding Zn-ribbon protein
MTTRVSVFYSFARSGGTLLNRCIGSIPGNIVLSEVNPCGDVIPLETQACEWFNLISQEEALKLSQESYVSKISFLAHRAQERSLNLVLRDWSAVNFINHASNDFHTSSMELEQEFYLVHSDLVVNCIVFCRKSEDVYVSIKRNFPHLSDISVQVFGEIYHGYAQKVSKYQIFHYEDFCKNPPKILKEICRCLNINYDDAFIDSFKDYSFCTGDNQLVNPSRGYDLENIKELPPLEDSHSRAEIRANRNLAISDRLLKYSNQPSIPDMTDPSFKILESRDLEIADLSSRLKALNVKYADSLGKIESLGTQLRHMEAQHQKLEADNKALETQYQELEVSNKALEYRPKEMETKNKKLSSQYQDIENRYENIDNKLKVEKEKVAELSSKLESYQNIDLQRKYLENKCEHLQTEIASLNAINSKLEEQVDTLITGKGSLRHLIKLALKKANVYDFIYENHRLFVPVFNIVFRDNWLPATIYSNRPQNFLEDNSNKHADVPDIFHSAEQVGVRAEPKINEEQIKPDSALGTRSLIPRSPNQINLNSIEVETAVVLSYFTNESLDLLDLKSIGFFLANRKRVLCINPGKRILHLLLMMSKAHGNEVTCVSSSPDSFSEVLPLISVGCDVIPEGLIGLFTRKNSDLDFDLIVFDEVTWQELALFKGKLKENTSIIATDACENFENEFSVSENAALSLEQLKVYE